MKSVDLVSTMAVVLLGRALYMGASVGEAVMFVGLIAAKAVQAYIDRRMVVETQKELLDRMSSLEARMAASTVYRQQAR